MKINYQDLCKKYYKQAIANLQEWIKINSIYDEATKDKTRPFGYGVAEALEYIALLAEKDGYLVDRCQGYCTEITFGSSGPILDVYAHADVVPVSGIWSYPPFSGTIADDIIYGRGTSDDKGPALAAYYALKALNEHHLINGYQVRLVIGGNEESGSQCLHHYFNVLQKEYPVYGITPDGSFPLIYGEKGISNYKTIYEEEFPGIISIEAGVVANSVIDVAKAVVRKDNNLPMVLKTTGLNCTYEEDDKHGIITIYGKAAHGSTPKQGLNAGIQLLSFLGDYYNIISLGLIARVYSDPSGKKLGHYYQTELLKETTYNVGLINYHNGVFSMVVNFRYPETVDVTKVVSEIDAKLGVTSTILGKSKPLLIDPLSPMVTTLLKAYQEETGDLESPIMTIGGGTYARESRNTIAFGSAFPHSHDNIHDADEHITIHDYLLSMAIYAHAIHALGVLACA